MGYTETVTTDTVREFGREEWNRVVESSATGRVFHRYGFLRAMEQGFPGSPSHVAVREGGELQAFLPGFLRPLKLPGMKYLGSYHARGGPVIGGDDEKDSLDRVVVEAERTGKKNGAAFHYMSAPDNSSFRYSSRLKDLGYRSRIDVARHVLELSRGVEELKAGMEEGFRKEFDRLHDEHQVEEVVSPGEEELIDFYEDYKSR